MTSTAVPDSLYDLDRSPSKARFWDLSDKIRFAFDEKDYSFSSLDIRLVKGDGRYYVQLDGVTLGWVLRRGADWIGYCSSRTEFAVGTQRVIGRTRREAVEGVVTRHAIYGLGA